MNVVRLILFIYLVAIQFSCNSASENTKIKRWGNHKNSSNRTSLIDKVNIHRLYDGENAYVSPLCLGMQSNYGLSFYGFNTYIQLIKFSDQCFVGPARQFVDTTTIPPRVTGYPWFSALCPRPICDLNFHSKEMILNSVPYYDSILNKHDISVLKTKGPVVDDHKCGGPPLESAWISCDQDGPPEDYTDCFFASYGSVKQAPFLSPPDIVPTKVQAIILSKEDCQRVSQQTTDIGYNPYNEICASTLEGVQPVCRYDQPFMFCKYWKNDGENSGGWGSTNGWRSNKRIKESTNGWGSNSPKSPDMQNLLAVGHYEDYFGGSPGVCDGSFGINIYLKYGSPTYRDIFTKCGYYCSDSLKSDYQCKGNPPKSLGPVYCYPEKIPENHQGWNSISSDPES